MDGYCTLNTDASVGRAAGGWAVWITTDAKRIKEWGTFRQPVADSNMAEMMAIINGIHIIKRRLPKPRILVVNTDSLFCRNVINRQWVSANPELATMARRLILECRYFPKVYAKEIRGHTTINTPRHAVNRWCDAYARRGMRGLVDAVTKGK